MPWRREAPTHRKAGSRSRTLTLTLALALALALTLTSALTLGLAPALALALSRWAHMSTQDAEAMRVAAEIRGGLEAREIWGDMGEM